jgi:hypothetical protein
MKVLFLRISDKEKKILEEESLKMQMTQNAYCRMILMNHLGSLGLIKKVGGK